MIYTPKTKKAMIIAYNAHNGQVDKSGIPYLSPNSPCRANGHRNRMYCSIIT